MLEVKEKQGENHLLWSQGLLIVLARKSPKFWLAGAVLEGGCNICTGLFLWLSFQMDGSKIKLVKIRARWTRFSYDAWWECREWWEPGYLVGKECEIEFPLMSGKLWCFTNNVQIPFVFFLQGKEGSGGNTGPRGRKVAWEIHSGKKITQRFCYDILFAQHFSAI